VTPEQITEWNLPSRPTKATDTRAKGFKGDSVELDAIPACGCEACCMAIERHIDPVALEVPGELRPREKSLLDLQQHGSHNGRPTDVRHQEKP